MNVSKGRQKPRRNAKMKALTPSQRGNPEAAHGNVKRAVDQARHAPTPQTPQERMEEHRAWSKTPEARTQHANHLAGIETRHASRVARGLPPVPETAPAAVKTGLSRGTKIAAGALVATAAAGGAYALHRRHQRSKAVTKNLINPFEDVVVFGKAYKTSFFPQSSSRSAALVPTGKHLGHGNRLGHFRGTGVSPQGTGLRKYTTNVVGLKQGPFTGAGASSKIPSGARRGKRL